MYYYIKLITDRLKKQLLYFNNILVSEKNCNSFHPVSLGNDKKTKICIFYWNANIYL